MNRLQELVKTARQMVAPGKGILAIDESTTTCNKRFTKLGIPTTEEARRAYRELLLTTPGLGEFVSGAIFYDETIRQATRDGKPFLDVMNEAGILPGIKVDTGTVDYDGVPGEKLTQGLDGLVERVATYRALGARFAKWRAVITIGEGMPTRSCIEANAFALARYARICQDGGLVPIVEPEVLMDGAHTLERCHEVTELTLDEVFLRLEAKGVALEAIVLKPSMVISGADCPQQADVLSVAQTTVKTLRQAVPAWVAGIAFLSGGQSDELATAHLDAMNRLPDIPRPWPLTFSYGRALQQPALEIWRGQEANVAAAQRALYHRARCTSAASLGEYTRELEEVA